MGTYECPICNSSEEMYCIAEIAITYKLCRDGSVENESGSDYADVGLEGMKVTTCTACGFKGTLKEFQKN